MRAELIDANGAVRARPLARGLLALTALTNLSSSHDRKILDRLAERLKGKVAGEVTVKLWESHNAWASYTGSLSGKAFL